MTPYLEKQNDLQRSNKNYKVALTKSIENKHKKTRSQPKKLLSHYDN